LPVWQTFPAVAFGSELLDFTPQTLTLNLNRLHRAVHRTCPAGICVKLFLPLADDVVMHTRISRPMGNGYAPVPNQAHSLKLQLSRKLATAHNAPPASQNHSDLVSVKLAAAHFSRVNPSITLNIRLE
jgi:hypothetical protein